MTRDTTNKRESEQETPVLNGECSDPEEWLATEMKRQYRRTMRDKNAAKAQNSHEENEPPNDPNINRRTGKVLGFDVVGRTDILHIDVLTHTGYVITAKVSWPDDPTDETEDFVRLCRWLDIPLTDISQLNGAYVPLRHWGRGRSRSDVDDGSKLQLEIPPIDAPGNRLKYRVHRFFQTHKWANYAVPGLMASVVLFGWVPIFATVGFVSDVAAAPRLFFVSVVGWASFMCMWAVVLFVLAIVSSVAHQRLFPSPE